MSERLVATFEQRRSGARVVRLAGVLDEHNGLGELTEKIGEGVAIINLAEVEAIDARGADAWRAWLAALEANGARPVLTRCSPAVVAELNRLADQVGGLTVKSFQVPYRCATCERDHLEIVYLADLVDEPHGVSPCICETCGAPMAFVGEPERYFAFVRELARYARESEPPRGSAPRGSHSSASRLARGSGDSLTAEHLKRISRPRVTSRESRPSMSAFQLPEERRASEHDLTIPRPRLRQGRGHLYAIVGLLFGMVLILLFLLLI